MPVGTGALPDRPVVSRPTLRHEPGTGALPDRIVVSRPDLRHVPDTGAHPDRPIVSRPILHHELGQSRQRGGGQEVPRTS